MYLEHFQLTCQPFSEHAALAALWQDARMAEGLARLEHLVAHGVLGLVTGPTGVGKSALLKQFLHGLPAQHCEAVYCHLSHLPAAGMLKLVVTQLGDLPRRGKDRLYQQILERAARSEGTLLLVFDEAHLLDAAALTDLRLLISSALDIGPPLKILLAGQDTLRRTGHADLLNRVSVRYQLRPLSKDQTTRYLDFQMTQAGGSPKTFDDSVKDLIHDFTGGVPRQINNLATACLLQATARKLARVDDAVFQQAAHEFQLP
ncbi:MAG TPA: AAA family ATPase [Pirellulales bacterium]|nr:AAA family ATPase [Pirellulales bacterium]